MIYLVTNNVLYQSDKYEIISIEKSLHLLSQCTEIEVDSETTGIDPHIVDLLCFQFGNKEKDFQIVVDCQTVDIKNYKEILETKQLIGHNLCFDCKFLYKHGIIPTKIWDTMIIEQLLHLGYDNKYFHYGLKDVLERRLNMSMDKSIRSQINLRGLDETVILYAAGDVTYLTSIKEQQYQECIKKDCLKGAQLENNFVRVNAYLEWCGIKLDKNKWKEKMKNDQEQLSKYKKDLDNFLIKNKLSKYYHIDLQGDLFEGWSDEPICDVNWDSSQQVVQIVKDLGFNTSTPDKKTGEDKDTVLEKHLKIQKGINDEFLELYFKFKEFSKVVSTYGANQLNAVNPITGRIHTTYKQLGASSGRMSCGSNSGNPDLAKIKNMPTNACKYPNIQQLPHDEITRSCFVSEEGNCFISSDFSSMESYLAADIYNDKAFQDEFLYGSGDTHSLFAWMVFRKECEALGCTCVADIKTKAKQWRQAVKAIEFAYLFGAAAPTIAKSANCSEEQAQKYIDDLNEGFKGISTFAKKGLEAVKQLGYVLINEYTGHKMYWEDHQKWITRQKSFTKEFWEEYKLYHKGTGDKVALEVREHFQAIGKWGRMVRNAPTQGENRCPV